jgi:hypothetical protein
LNDAAVFNRVDVHDLAFVFGELRLHAAELPLGYQNEGEERESKGSHDSDQEISGTIH